MIGDPPNIIIGNMLSDHVGFLDFVTNLMPCILLCCWPAMAFLKWNYKDYLDQELDDFDTECVAPPPLPLSLVARVARRLTFSALCSPHVLVKGFWFASVSSLILFFTLRSCAPIMCPYPPPPSFVGPAFVAFLHSSSHRAGAGTSSASTLSATQSS